jgi:hypothetical protein
MLDQIGFRVTRSLQVHGRFPSKDSLHTVNKTKKLKKFPFTTDLLVKGRKHNTCEGNLFLFFETKFSPVEKINFFTSVHRRRGEIRSHNV